MRNLGEMLVEETYPVEEVDSMGLKMKVEVAATADEL